MSRQARILIAEDEAPLRNLVRMSLEASGHQVVTANDGQDALNLFFSQPFDLVVLDVMMPHVDGFDACSAIRLRSDVPIILLTALGSTDDMVRGFELGADDYITKPFSFREVQARIHAILRRNQWLQDRRTPPILRNGLVALDIAAPQARVGGHPIHLTPIEFKLLYTLMSRAGNVISKNDLFVEVWGYEFVGGTNLVEVTVRRLREKIEPDPSRPTCILTVRGMGYKFRPAEQVSA